MRRGYVRDAGKSNSNFDREGDLRTGTLQEIMM